MFISRKLSVNSEFSASEKHKTQEGYLVNKNVPISRAGIFVYPASEFGIESDSDIVVYRPLETFTPELLKQISMVPLTDQHPVDPVDSETIADEYVGKLSDNIFMQGNDCIAGDVIVQAKRSVDNVENGSKQELSIGFNANYKLEPGVFEGQSYQYIENIERVNHLAIVYKGKSGAKYRLNEKLTNPEEEEMSLVKNEDTDEEAKAKEDNQAAIAPEESKSMKKNEYGDIMALLNQIYEKVCQSSAVVVNEDKEDDDKKDSDAKKEDVKENEDAEASGEKDDDKKDMKNSGEHVGLMANAFNSVDNNELHSKLEGEDFLAMGGSANGYQDAAISVSSFINKK